MNFRCKSSCSCSMMHMVNLKFDFNHFTVQKWIRNTKILHSNSLISLLIRSGTSRAIGVNSGYHAPMADYILLHKSFHIQSMVHSTPIVNQYWSIYIYSNPHLQTLETGASKLKNNSLLLLFLWFVGYKSESISDRFQNRRLIYFVAW